MWTCCQESARAYQTSPTLWLHTSSPCHISCFAIPNSPVLIIISIFNSFTCSLAQTSKANTVFYKLDSHFPYTICTIHKPVIIYANILVKTINATIAIPPSSTARLAFIADRPRSSTTQYSSIITTVYANRKVHQSRHKSTGL